MTTFPQATLLRRHLPRALCVIAACHVLSIFTVDSPHPTYHCPLDRDGLSHRWTDENCYWSNGYAEGREKFVSLGNLLKEQVLSAENNGVYKHHGGGGALDILDVKSISYDIAREDFSNYVDSLKANDSFTPQMVTPGTDTVDALLLTLRIPERRDDGGSNDGNVESVDIVHSSGTHGVEGYLGAAVQIRFLHELYLRNEKQQRLANNPRAASPSASNNKVRKILLIHAVNPHGMRHHRRTNENNVDLNRNVLSDEMWTNLRKRGMQGNAIHSWLYEKKRALRMTMNVVAAIATWDSQTRRGVW